MKDGDFLVRYNNYDMSSILWSSLSAYVLHMMQLLAMFEAMKKRAWTDTRDPKEVIHLAKERLASSDWNQVRPAISATVRYVYPMFHVDSDLPYACLPCLVHG